MRFSSPWWLFSAALIVAALGANAQLPIVNSSTQNGKLTSINLQPGTVAPVEWAASLEGPWHTNWTGLDAVTVSSNGVITVNVPKYYRVRGVASAMPSPPPGMVWIPPGTFVMGSPETEKERGPDETQHTVTLTKGFYMSKYLVTQGQYLALMGGSWSLLAANDSIDAFGQPISPDLNRPVENVTWFEATLYCKKLTASEQAAGRLPAGWVYRLPTESEWEYACRAGTTTAFNLGPDLRSGMANCIGYWEYIGGMGTVLNTNGFFWGRTTPVGSYTPNAWGLYDMHGNANEWCMDWYDWYPVGSVTDPTGPSTGSGKALRGGAWSGSARYCRSATRLGVGADDGAAFRPVLAPSQ